MAGWRDDVRWSAILLLALCVGLVIGYVIS
jgi:uncharacterized membrane-anchored protein YhcB (DUF1043 family)